MTINKRAKTSRQRGSHTHGWGAMKKHRGAGNRGGRGLSGTGKRGDQKKPSIWKDKNYFGRHGFKPKNARAISPTNIAYLEDKYPVLLKKGLIKEESGVFVIELVNLKFNKILGTGTPTRKYKIIAEFASKKAIEKISATGGKVELIEKKNPAEKKEVKKEPKSAPTTEAVKEAPKKEDTTKKSDTE